MCAPFCQSSKSGIHTCPDSEARDSVPAGAFESRTIRSGIVIRQWLEQHRIDDAEDGGVGADAQRQRQDRNDGEAGVARSERIA